MAENRGVRPARVLAAVCLGYGMIIVDGTVVNVAVPAMQAGLGAGLDTMQLVVDGYVVVLASLLLAGAALSDRFGAARMFRTGIAVFGLASLLCGLAVDGPQLVAARVAQGLAAVLLVPASLIVVTQAYTEPAARARALALWATLAGSPAAFGPILGGLVVDTLGWRAVFLLNLPVTVGALLLTRRGLPPSVANRVRRQDLPGQVFAVLVLAGLAVALTEAHALGWTAPVPAVSAAVAVLAAIAFVVRQRTAAEPMLAPDLLRAPGFRGYVSVGTLMFFSYYGMVFVLSVYLQQVRHLTPLLAGLSFLPSALPITLLPLLSGRLVSRWGPQRVLLAGNVISVLGAVLLAVAGNLGTVPLGIGMLVFGCGIGLGVVPQLTLVVQSAPPDRAALASGLFNSARQSGTVLGVAVLGGLPTAAGLGLPAGITALVCAATVPVVWQASRDRRPDLATV